MKLSAVIIARNEEKNIGDCLKSVSFCDEKVVVDSGSTDETIAVAQSAGAKVFRRAFDDFASQKNFAMQQASGDWLLFIDADERVSPELAGEIRQELADARADGYRLPRKNNLFGRWMRHGSHRGDRPLRLVRKGKAVFDGIVHESLRLEGREGGLNAPLLHYSTQTVDAYRKKLDLYTTLEARALKERGVRVSLAELWLRPSAVFLKQTLWQAGLLDGRQGLLFSWLSARYEFERLLKCRQGVQ